MVKVEKQPRHSPIVDGDAVPHVQRVVTQPVSFLEPIGTIGGVVEHHQRRPVGCKVLSPGPSGQKQDPQQGHKSGQDARR